jgi:hypothetical protein
MISHLFVRFTIEFCWLALLPDKVGGMDQGRQTGAETAETVPGRAARVSDGQWSSVCGRRRRKGQAVRSRKHSETRRTSELAWWRIGELNYWRGANTVVVGILQLARSAFRDFWRECASRLFH